MRLAAVRPGDSQQRFGPFTVGNGTICTRIVQSGSIVHAPNPHWKRYQRSHLGELTGKLTKS